VVVLSLTPTLLLIPGDLEVPWERGPEHPDPYLKNLNPLFTEYLPNAVLPVGICLNYLAYCGFVSAS